MPNFIETTDAAGNSSTGYTLQVGQTAQGTLSGTGDHDWYRVNLTAGQTYSFAMTGTGTNNVQDPYLRLYSVDGTSLLISNDDGLPGQNSVMSYTALTTGTYYLDASAYSAFDTGQYGVSFTAGSRPSFDTQMGAGVIDTDSSWSAAGVPATVTYGFRQSPATYTAGTSNISTFTQLTATEEAAVRATLQLWSSIANINFVEVNPGGYTDSATMLFGNYTDSTDGAGAFAYYPGSTASTSNSGDVWLNTTSISTSTTITPGSYSFLAIMHEIGHAIGLSHPGLYNAAAGVSITYANNAQFQQDSRQYSIMSYFNESNTGAQFNGYPDTPMLFDDYAVQQIYGANTSTRAGDTTYGFNCNAGSTYDFTQNTNPAYCIWDAGGNDTIDASGYSQNQLINLAAESFSNIGALTSNISIAAGAIIENAIGGSGNDSIYGNAANNTLSGGAGNDTLDGGAGNDTLIGGAGTNALIGGGGFDKATYAVASTAVTITHNPNGSVTIIGNGFSDTLTGVENAVFTDKTVSLRERGRSDFTGNGTSDIVLQSGGSIVDWIVNGSSVQSGAIVGSYVPGWDVVATGDFNGDGVTDLLLKNGGTIVDWSIQNGAVSNASLVGSGLYGWNIVGTGDFNGDGTSDILLQNGGTIVDWTVQNGTVTSASVVGSYVPGWTVVGNGDFNGDGTSDILLQNGGTIVVWNMQNGVVSGAAVVGTGIAGWTVAGTGDFNGDGTADILLKNGGVFVDWQIQNNIVSAAKLVANDPGFAAWNVVGTGDYNGDGIADIALQIGSTVLEWNMANGLIASGGILGTTGGYAVRG